MKNTSIKSSASSGRKGRLVCFFASWLAIVGCLLLWASPATMQTGLLRSVLNLLVIKPAVLLQSQSSTFYLHGTGPADNPPTIFLNTTAPTATTEKYKDSASVNRNGGNPWKEIGTWPASASMTTSSVTSLSDLHVWLGLKNSDDQGTYFDLRVEAYKNSTLITSGQSLCITGITRNASTAKEVVVGFDPFSATSFNGTSDLLKLKILTRVGSTAAGASCGGHSNAVGLRLYFDAVSRSARFTVTSGAADTTAPALTVSQPTENSIIATTQVTVSGTFSDQSPTTVKVNGVNAGIQGNSYSLAVPLSEGQNSLLISAIDSAGNHTDITRHVVRDTTQPQLSIQQPADGSLTNSTQVQVNGTVNDATLTAVTVNNVSAPLTGNSFTATVQLVEGANAVQVHATDAAGNQSDLTLHVNRDSVAPTILISSPASGLTTNAAQITVVGTFADASPVSVTVNGAAATIDENQFMSTVVIAGGTNSIQIVATDAATNQSTQSVTVTGDSTSPVITLTAPAEGSVAKSVVVAGHVTDDSFPSLLIDNTPVPIDANGDFRTEFRPEDGPIEVRLVAVDRAGNSIELIRNLTVDNTPPVIDSFTPAAGAVVDSPLTLGGHAEDITAVVVQVNGVNAVVRESGDFSASNIMVPEGEISVSVVATDAAGNAATSSLTLFGRDRTPPAPPTVVPVISPTRLIFQTIEGRTESGAKVRISNGSALVEADAAIGTGLYAGLVNLSSGQNTFTVTAVDAEGNASQPVQVTIEQDPNLPLPPSGQAARINISTGDTQKGLTNLEMPRPLIAIVTDRDGHPVSSANVHFNLQFGNGAFVGGGSTLETTTDAQGHANARYVSGSVPGPQLIRADFAGNSGTPAVFIVETLSAAPTGSTTVSGIVLDQNLRALPNVLVRIGGQETRTETDGRFVVTNVASGPHQLLELIGRDQIPLPGRWPNISHDFDVLPGIDNDLGRPLFLPRVNNGIAMPLDSSSIITQDTTFELPLVAGEAPIRVTAKAGTRVTFPPDVTDKRLSVTRIARNRVPMGLEDGLATSLYISVQPSGAVFETPLEVSFPNLDHLAASSEVLLMSFDHDAGRYVQVGTGHVSADGRSIVGDPGSGIRVGAWHGFPPPRPEPEATVLTHITVKGNPLFADATVFKSETFAEDKRFVMVTEASQIATADQLDFRLTLAVPENSALQVQAQNTTKVSKVKVKQLTFSGDKYFSVFEDRSGADTEYGVPHWKDNNCDLAASCDGKASDNGDSRFPVVFVRSTPSQDSFIKVSATFVLGETIPPSPVKVIGDGPGDLDFEATVTTETESGHSVFKINNVQSKGALPQTIKLYNPLEITWKYSFDKDVTFADVGKFKTAGKTDNRVYVLLGTPPSSVPLFGGSQVRRETVLDVSVRSADGQSTEAATVAAIWREFATRAVKRKKTDGKNNDDNKKMTYWGPRTVQERAGDVCQTLSAMINPTPTDPVLNGVGTCKAWTEFLFAVIAVQGITGIDIVEIKPIEIGNPNQSKGFMVKNWIFAKHIRTGPDGILVSTFVDTDFSRFNNPKTGNGFPNQLCVGPGTNGTLETTDLKGDDAVVGDYVSTGPNGRCQTTALATDEQLIKPGKGFPESVGIAPGDDEVLTSTSTGNDHVLDTGVVMQDDPNFPFLSRTAFQDHTTNDDFKDGDAFIGPRIRSQGGIDESPALFDNHFILRYGGKFYDASYGAGPFDNVGDHEKAAADGITNNFNRVQKKNPTTRILVYRLVTCFPGSCSTTPL